MDKKLIVKLKSTPRIKLLILLFVLWQYSNVLGMALLGWPDFLIWINLGLLLGFVILSPTYESLLLLVLSIPFFLALPNRQFDAFSMWRPLFFVLFAVWIIRDLKFDYKKIKFLPWDKYLGIFAGTGIIVTLIFANFVMQGFKQLVFWLNIYVLYLVLVNVLKSKQQIFELIRYTIWSLAVIITLGFTQLISTFLTNMDTFWVFWASNITRLYYGETFAGVSLYSNSWFSFVGGRNLRMFSIMPDSQSFAYICIFGMCMGMALMHKVFQYVRKWLWSGISFAGLGMLLSGTRAVWVGMLLPFFAVIWAKWKNIQPHLAKKFIFSFVIIIALFMASPFINKGLSFLRVNNFQEDFLGRAKSIYDLNNVSNTGRFQIWKDSLAFAIKNPLGKGLGNFIISLQNPESNKSYADLAGEINERYNLPQRFVSAHNLYLQILVETGVIGFGFFIWFWLFVLRYFWHFLKNYKKAEDFLVYFVAQAFLMTIWILGAGFFDITLFNDKVLMFTFINLGIAGLIVNKYHEYNENI